MEDDEIELISGGDKLQEVAQVLQEFLRKVNIVINILKLSFPARLTVKSPL